MRRSRNELPPAGIYHVTTRGVARTAIFLDDGERRLFLRLFAAEVQRHDWRCHAFNDATLLIFQKTCIDATNSHRALKPPALPARPTTPSA